MVDEERTAVESAIAEAVERITEAVIAVVELTEPDWKQIETLRLSGAPSSKPNGTGAHNPVRVGRALVAAARLRSDEWKPARALLEQRVVGSVVASRYAGRSDQPLHDAWKEVWDNLLAWFDALKAWIQQSETTET